MAGSEWGNGGERRDRKGDDEAIALSASHAGVVMVVGRGYGHAEPGGSPYLLADQMGLWKR